MPLRDLSRSMPGEVARRAARECLRRAVEGKGSGGVSYSRFYNIFCSVVFCFVFVSWRGCALPCPLLLFPIVPLAILFDID